MRFLFIVAFYIGFAQAAPVFNANVAGTGEYVTVWPDHKDPNLFYYAPAALSIAVDRRGGAKFNVTSFLTNCNRFNRCTEKAKVTVFFAPILDQKLLEDAQALIRKRKPNAVFSPVPFLASKLDMGGALAAFVELNDCSSLAGLAGDEVACSMILNPRGVRYLLPSLNAGQVHPMKFSYSLSGVSETVQGYRDVNLDFIITIKFGGEILVNHPDLQGW